MKTLPKLILILFCLLVGTKNSFGTTYSTLGNGSYNNTSIWSTNGVTSCGCAPPLNLTGHTLNIDHAIALTGNLVLNAGTIINVSALGSVSGTTFNINNDAGVLNLGGNVNINKLSIGTNGSINILGCVLTLNQKLDVYGDLNIDNGYLLLNNGSFNVQNSGSVIVTNSSKIDVLIGNIDNGGYVFIDSDCCLTTNGNWSNLATGTIEGNGTAQSTLGNMSNTGIWGAGISWCSAGFDFGMPTSENCLLSNNICGVINLPVVLVSFTGAKNEASNSITWSTASEVNSAYFILEKSSDAIEFNELEHLNAAGNSNQLHTYSVSDPWPYPTTYYRLRQVDYDGSYVYYGPIAVTNNVSSDFTIDNVYPNPAEDFLYADIYSKEAGQFDIYILNCHGNVVHQSTTEAYGRISLSIPVSSLVSGIYTLKMLNQQTQVQHIRKLIIR